MIYDGLVSTQRVRNNAAELLKTVTGFWFRFNPLTPYMKQLCSNQVAMADEIDYLQRTIAHLDTGQRPDLEAEIRRLNESRDAIIQSNLDLNAQLEELRKPCQCCRDMCAPGCRCHGKDSEDDAEPEGWLCYCGHWEESGMHCSVCHAQPPWGCDCSDCHDREMEEADDDDAIYDWHPSDDIGG